MAIAVFLIPAGVLAFPAASAPRESDEAKAAPREASLPDRARDAAAEPVPADEEAARQPEASLLEVARGAAAGPLSADEEAQRQTEAPEEAPEQDEEKPEEGIAGLRHEEEVQVTGTAIRETPIDSPYPVSFVNRDTLMQRGSPQLVDMFKSLTVSSGVIGEVNSWYAGGVNLPETVANVNLRGLGASRTLVLINGRRQVPVPAQLVGGRFVDVNSIPGIAVQRLDVLKEGAGAIYGSDAISGVVNFITRNTFEGLEVQASHEYFEGAGDSLFSGIWGRRFGTGNVIVAFEHQRRARLDAEERSFALRPYPNWWWGWSGVGNPGAFIVPGAGPLDETALAAAPRFVDPQCENFGGHVDNGLGSCRFRYQAWDDLIAETRHTRALVEIAGDVGDRGHYRIEGLYADGRTPEWETTPSFPPVSLLNQAQLVGPDHPGRQALAARYPAIHDTGGAALDLTGGEPWYFFGRLVGNSGPGRVLKRESATSRIAASLGGELGGGGLHYDIGAVFARSTGNVNQPAEYAYRKFLAFRGFGGPGCGVEVVVDPNSPSRMALGDTNGAAPGQGNCMYYNPFSNGLQFSAQPGSPYLGAANAEYEAALANSTELLGWINEEVNVESTSDLFTADATLNGVLSESASYAVGYQFRRVGASARPNDAGNLSLNPCPVPGDRGCVIQTGPFTFTTARHPYDANQTTHAVFTELALRLGPRFDAQIAGHYERYEFADSFDPKLAVIFSPIEHFALRGTAQTSFRTPSVDDLNEDLATYLDWVSASGTWKAIDDSGSSDLLPEQAFTYNLGMTVSTDGGFDATLDYWNFDFDNPISTLPHSGIVSAYVNPATRSQVQHLITCPGGVTDGSCDPVDIERIRVQRINFPGLKTSGLDGHLGYRGAIGTSALVFGFDASYTLDYTVEALSHAGVEVQPEEQAAGFLNRPNPLAPPLPKLRTHTLLSYLFGQFTITGVSQYISGYTDRTTIAEYENIDSWLIFDANLQYRVPDTRMVITLSALNLTGVLPPLVNQELAFDALTHNPKGRRFKLGVSYRF